MDKTQSCIRVAKYAASVQLIMPERMIKIGIIHELSKLKDMKLLWCLP